MRILIKDNSTLAIIESSIIFCNESLNPCENVIVCLLDAEGDYWASEKIPIKEYEYALTTGLVSGYINFSGYRFTLDDSDDDKEETGKKERRKERQKAVQQLQETVEVPFQEDLPCDEPEEASAI